MRSIYSATKLIFLENFRKYYAPIPLYKVLSKLSKYVLNPAKALLSMYVITIRCLDSSVFLKSHEKANLLVNVTSKVNVKSTESVLGN